ncbi:acyl-CoA dehydratase activase-related protein [Sutterella sp.]|uniref:acyl-CoA dehydratase activase-related protein n=1 Tax=Sutterella sp. TaxID=1981025 RepID=UPI0026DEE1D4|nr:acyl-CoA dehydratase activase-related protein [Sutterella sp.]MDO5531813.1 acyl-CoA dehydratase activase-related protein [Sutterella sp.]
MLTLGIDLGSTTVKFALLSEEGTLLAHDYLRHASAVKATLLTVLRGLSARTKNEPVRVLFSGSGALAISETLGAAFVQEVIAASRYLRRRSPDLDAAVELGGEDAKLLYLSNGVELRMNEACAGGTGAFIDQMATLLDTDAPGLDALALEAKTSHPMASRCGVFAKTDLVALLNAGIPRSEVARSVLDAVAEQTVSGLACGRPVAGRIAFLGGPLTFMRSLREAMERRLAAPGTTFETYADAHCSVAIGAALEGLDPGAEAHRARVWPTLATLIESIDALPEGSDRHSGLPPLFSSAEERAAFTARHAREAARRVPLSEAKGDLFLGTDLGSTTVKGALVDSEGRLVASWYAENQGKPLEQLFAAVKRLIPEIPEGARIRQAATTGYGADLARAALGAAFSEVETLTHARAAAAFDPQVSYVIDIGGQDMKCLEIRQGLISGVKLNEACSSGCGSFLQTFARQLKLSLPEFVGAALSSEHPCDLGTRCTVFMNSRVRQAQRDGAAIEDIAAGLCRSIVRNALYKVLRIHDPEELGDHVLVQGGTFLNDAVLRAFEQQIGRNVIRPDIAGLMGAYGAALIALERTEADTPVLDLSDETLDATRVIERELLCKGCGNRCRLTMSRFPTGEKFFSGNRCDFAAKSAGGRKKDKSGFIDWKTERLFAGEPLAPEAARMGTVGIPRALDTWEHYPYWFTLFTNLGFRVELSRPSDHALAALASATVPSQSLCFPAKLLHGHVTELAQKGIKDIWMPCVPFEGPRSDRKSAAAGRFACPVAGGYPEAMRLSIDTTLPGARILTPFVDLEHAESVVRAVRAAWPSLSAKEVRRAAESAHAALLQYQSELRAKGEALWHARELSGEPLIVIAGRPYHLDPLINHGLPALIESMGAAVVTEDAVAHLADLPSDISVVNQWTFHARLYRAAALVRESRSAELVQLMSFGCGIDAITSEQIERLLSARGRISTTIKIDEGDTLGAARIRLKSLLAAVADRRRHDREAAVAAIESVQDAKAPEGSAPANRPLTTREVVGMRTIYVPQMAPLHFPILCAALRATGWNAELLPEVTPRAIEEGLKHVNNDACYPAIVVIGQLIDALKTREIDPERSALLLAQTCGPCRATNYPSLLKWALGDLHLENVPVVTLSGGRIEGAETLDLGLMGLKRLMIGCLYGDLLQRLTLFVRAYERVPGTAESLVPKWTKRAEEAAAAGDSARFRRDAREMVREFLAIERSDVRKPRVGIVGEILLKYHPAANLGIVDTILAEGAEPVLGDIASFLLYCLHDHIEQARAFGASRGKALFAWLTIRWFEHLRSAMRDALDGTPIAGVATLAEELEAIEGLVSPGQQAGEGWLLTAEMASYVREGVPNVVCLQPFGCLPNHVTGKGVMKRLRDTYPGANLTAIDFEAGTSRANVANRLKLFLAQARENFAKGASGAGDRADGAVMRRVIPIHVETEGAAHPTERRHAGT